ncbi:hypothetical protein [Duganella sp. LjRoot269]|uniref:hypothetical protein n=1 Tax=Duganella sp. LjRoot269 TaxID=3342305 RepID=UPI003ECCE9F3
MTIPSDFPREPMQASLAGAQPKVSVRVDALSGRYTDAPTESEIAERYEVCEDLAGQLVAKCRKNRTEKYAALTEQQILERLLAQLLGTGWGSSSEMRWVIRRTAAVLGWKIPESSTVLNTLPTGA